MKEFKYVMCFMYTKVLTILFRGNQKFLGFSHQRRGHLGLCKSLLDTKGQTEANVYGEQNIARGHGARGS